jgi:hypothetical protein
MMKELNVKAGDKVRFIRKWVGTSPCYDIEVGTVATSGGVQDGMFILHVPRRNFPFYIDKFGRSAGGEGHLVYIEPVPTYNIGDKIVFSKPLECFNKGDVAEITGSKATGYSWEDLAVRSVSDRSVTSIVDSENEAFSLYKEASTDEGVLTEPTYLTFPETLHALADGKAVTVAKENPHIATGVTYYLKDNELTVKDIQGKCVEQKAMYKLEHLAKVDLVLAPEPKPWYEDLEGKPRLCWVWDMGNMSEGTERTIEIIVGYDNDYAWGNFRDSQGVHWEYATPLTKEEIQTYLDNA